MEIIYREHGSWFDPSPEIRVRNQEIFVGDRLPVAISLAELTGLRALAQRVLDAEDQFEYVAAMAPNGEGDELEFHSSSRGQSRAFRVRRGIDTPPAAFDQLIADLKRLCQSVAPATR